jgi:hypothetical protein
MAAGNVKEDFAQQYIGTVSRVDQAVVLADPSQTRSGRPSAFEHRPGVDIPVCLTAQTLGYKRTSKFLQSFAEDQMVIPAARVAGDVGQ